MKDATALAALAALLPTLLIGAWLTAVLDRMALTATVGRPFRIAPLAPLRQAAAWMAQQRLTTERPDALNWWLAPGFYLALAATGLSVVPLAPGFVAVDISTGIVLWGACEALTIVVVFLHGWSANAPLALIGAFRYVAIGLPAMLLSMFVLIAAALPAESLSVVAIVDSQAEVWNVVRQPTGLVLFLLLGLTISLRGPFDYAMPFDLAGGTRAEVSGPARAAWEFARLSMLVAVAGMASAAFLGGYHGPLLPAPLWMALKTVLVLAILVGAGRLLARMPAPRMLTLLWVVLLPLSFLNLALVGSELLL